jgi:hypothetical protein
MGVKARQYWLSTVPARARVAGLTRSMAATQLSAIAFPPRLPSAAAAITAPTSAWRLPRARQLPWNTGITAVNSTSRVVRSAAAVDASLSSAPADPSASCSNRCAQSVGCATLSLGAAVDWSQTHLKTGLRRARLRCALGGRGLATLSTLAAANLATCKRVSIDTIRTRKSYCGLALSIGRCETATDARAA